jgi:N-acetylglucosamine transport system substrate-binding protein
MFSGVCKKLLMVSSLVALACGCDALHRVPNEDDEHRELEVAIFEGGYGIQWHTKVAEEYSAERDGLSIELWGDPRTADIIKPRLLRGDPPDLILDERLPLWLLIERGKLLPFDEALASPGYGGEGTWSDQFADGMLAMYRSDGEVYAIPAAYGAWTCWYDARMFREHRWEAPETWRDFLGLCEAIHAEGIAPLSFQGKYANLYGWNTLVSLYQRVGGLAAINRINNLEPGAFSHPDAVRAADLMQDLAVEHFQHGAMAMTHTDSQHEFVKGNAAMIFCGIWLENEMKDVTPPGFEMRCFTVPAVADGKGNPAMVHAQGMEFLFVPVAARYPDEAFDFAKYMVSRDKAANMGKLIGVISPLKGATPRASLTPALGSVLDIIEASQGLYNVRLRDLLHEWRNQDMNVAISALLRGEMTPEAFGTALDDGVAAALKNPDFNPPAYVPYTPEKYGEPH